MSNIIHFKNGKFLPYTENWIYSTLVNLKRYRAIVYCNGLRNSETFPYKNITIFRRHNLPHQVMRVHPKIFFSLLHDRPNLVHAHFGYSGRDFLLYKKIFKLPMITSFYGMDLDQNEDYRSLFKNGDIFLAMGSFMKSQLIKLGCPEEKITIQHLGIEMGKIQFRKRALKKNEPVKVLIASRFTQKKGIPDALSSIAKLRNVKVTIIGDSNGSQGDENEKNKILEVVKKYNLKKKVAFLGFLNHEQLIKSFYNHHIFLSPSVTADNGDNEGGYNMSILEASASGMPVVSTVHCDIPDTIIDGRSGYLVPEHQPDLIAKKITQLINNSQIWPKMGQNGRELMEKEYAVAKLIPKLESVYDQTIRRWYRE